MTMNSYKEVKRSPLNKINTAANNVRKEITAVFGERFKWRIIVSNPEIPKLYCLPKIHKPGGKNETNFSNNFGSMHQNRKMVSQ